MLYVANVPRLMRLDEFGQAREAEIVLRHFAGMHRRAETFTAELTVNPTDASPKRFAGP